MKTATVLNVPKVRQCTEWSCGAAALLAVLQYMGRGQRISGELIEERDLFLPLGTNEVEGTGEWSMVRVARVAGLLAAFQTNLSVGDLQKSVLGGWPVLVSLQAWPQVEGKDIDPVLWDWENTWEEGHWVVVTGVDADFVYFMDPALGDYAYIPRIEFFARWHDYRYAKPDKMDTPAIFIWGGQCGGWDRHQHARMC